jgi:hypothetical protein
MVEKEVLLKIILEEAEPIISDTMVLRSELKLKIALSVQREVEF